MGDPITGLTTYPVTFYPPHIRVQWIAWFSPWRATGLQIGDRLIAVNGVGVTEAQIKTQSSQLPGMYGESYAFTSAGLTVGSPLTLRIRRRVRPTGWTELEFTAPLTEPPPDAQDERGTSLMAPGGPTVYDSGGFYTGGWKSWYEAVVKRLATQLDEDEQHGRRSFSTLSELRYLNEEVGPRVMAAVEKFPCEWSSQLKADYERALARMQGEAITLAPGALEYRRRGDALVQSVRQQSLAAWTAFKERHQANLIATFPAVHPTRGDINAVKGKVVVLPPLGNRDYLVDSGRTFFAAGSSYDGWYFLNAEAEAAEAMLRAQRRYERLVGPNLNARWELVARITGNPRLAVVNDRAEFGLELELLAALVGDAVFVDLTERSGTMARFAGEADLIDDEPTLPPNDASPAEVMAALLSSLKNNDLALWRALHADWWVETWGDNKRRIHPHALRLDESRFEGSRRLLAREVVDARTVWTDDSVILAPAGRFEGAESLEEVELWYEHIGDFPVLMGTSSAQTAEFRTFTSGMVTSTWRLQRVGSGPWRIAEAQLI